MNWETVRVQDIAEVFDGPHATPPKSDDGPIYLGIPSILPDGGIDYENSKRISYADFPKWTKRVTPRKDDVVFSYEANLESYAIIPEGFEGCLGRRMALMRPDTTKVNPRFLFYYMSSPQWRGVIAERTVLGATVNRIPIATFPQFPIELPPLGIQERISSILMAYDNLIENNRRQIALLEEAADLTYENWLDACDRSSFDTGTMSDFFDVTIGKTPPRAQTECFAAEGVPWASVKDLGNTAGPFISSTSECLTDEAIGNYKVKVKPAGTILLSFKLTIGRVAIAKQPTATNEAIAHFVTDSDAMRLYTYEYLRSFDYDTLGSTSSIGKAINSKIVKAIPFSLPNESNLNQLYSQLNPLFCAMRLYQHRASLLVEARDRLLPKLMSGEIEV